MHALRSFIGVLRPLIAAVSLFIAAVRPLIAAIYPFVAALRPLIGTLSLLAGAPKPSNDALPVGIAASQESPRTPRPKFVTQMCADAEK